MPDLNRPPHPCHGCALPDELIALIYDLYYYIIANFTLDFKKNIVYIKKVTFSLQKS